MIERVQSGLIYRCSTFRGDIFDVNDWQAPSTLTLSVDPNTDELVITQPTGAAGVHHMVTRVGSPVSTRRLVWVTPTGRQAGCDFGPAFMADAEPAGGFSGVGMNVPIGYNGQEGLYKWAASSSPSAIQTAGANRTVPHTSALWVDGRSAQCEFIPALNPVRYAGTIDEVLGVAGFLTGAGSANIVRLGRYVEVRDRYIRVQDATPGQTVEVIDLLDVVRLSATVDANGEAVFDWFDAAAFGLDGFKSIRIGDQTITPDDGVWPGDVYGEPVEPPAPPPSGAMQADVDCQNVTLRATLDDGPAVVVTWQIARIDDPDFADPVLVVGPTAPQWEEPPEGSFFGRLIFQAQLPAGTYLARVLAFTIVGFEGLNPIFQQIATPACAILGRLPKRGALTPPLFGAGP